MDAAELIGLGDHPALDFVNSTAVQGGVRLEGLSDGAALLSWLTRAGLIDEGDARQVAASFSRGELDIVAAEAVELREWLRALIADWASRPEPQLPAEAVRRLNPLLALDHAYRELGTVEDGSPELVTHRRWDSARALLVPLAVAAAELLSSGTPALVRRCEGLDCAMWFYDRTKAHRRRWCSMALCGNRAKARAHRSRQSGRSRRSP